MTGSAPAPLHGIRVLDLSRIAAGPFCTMQLADLGAEVIKVERPGHGDDTRHMTPPESGGEAHFYLAFNRNKRSIELDMKTGEGRDIVHRLAEKCDVLVQNFRPGVMARLGLDYDAMRVRHPHLIYCSISSYGQQGGMSDRPGLDPVLQAEMGHMMLTGQPDGEPTRSPLSITDLFVGLYASTAILSAVVARGETGRGQHIDLALMDGAVATLSNFAQAYLCSGENPPRTGNMHSVAVPAAAFQARDGMFYLACGTQRLYELLCNKVLERPDFLDNPKFVNNAARVANRSEFMTLLRDIFAAETLDHWMTKMRAAGVPAGPVRSVSEALESPEVRERGMVTTVPHPTAGEVRLVGTPYRLSDTPAVDPVAPPLRGQHTEAVLRGLLDLDDAAIAALRETKTIP
ncbi:MAG: CoA transferase [Alphaproteobacteria bacterium]|nr:CoA transferase [Alphaproteobacteria bacterium]